MKMKPAPEGVKRRGESVVSKYENSMVNGKWVKGCQEDDYNESYNANNYFLMFAHLFPLFSHISPHIFDDLHTQGSFN